MAELLKCRAQVSPNCYNGRASAALYGEGGMEADGLFDGDSVICDACYIAIGQPSVRVGASRADMLAHVNLVLSEFKQRCPESGCFLAAGHDGPHMPSL